MLRFFELSHFTGLPEPLILRALRRGEFPMPTREGGKERWYVDEVEAWRRASAKLLRLGVRA